MKLKFFTTLGQKHFRLDDVEDEAPMMQMEFFNEFAELPHELRMKAASAGLWKALEVLLAGASAPESGGGE